jgi:hypothetical protein
LLDHRDDAADKAPELSTPPSPVSAKTLSEDIIVADSHDVYAVNSQTKEYVQAFHTDIPVSGLKQNNTHLIVTVYNHKDMNDFQGFYDFTAQPGSPSPLASATPRKVETPAMQPRYTYLYHDLLLLASANQVEHPDGIYTKLGIYNLLSGTWVKQWEAPGAVQDVKGNGKDAYYVTGNNKSVPSNAYKVDINTGAQTALIQKPRWYPLDRVIADVNGDVFFAITQRERSEWSNKIYRYNPAQVPYELFDGFLSNTRSNSNDIRILNGKMFISRLAVSGANADIQQPLAVLDTKSKKQVYIEWDHRPVQIDVADNRFVAFAEDGTLGIVDPAHPEKEVTDIAIEEIGEGKFMAAKHRDDP